MHQEGRTALLVACWRGFLPIIIMLIKSGANTNAQDQVLYNSTYMYLLASGNIYFQLPVAIQ